MKYLCNCCCCIFVRAYFFPDESTWQNLTRFDLIGSLLREHQSNLSVGFVYVGCSEKKRISLTLKLFLFYSTLRYRLILETEQNKKTPFS